jgi:hypothetical protein
MKVALVESVTCKLVVAFDALEFKYTREKLPVKVFPRQLLCP